MSFSEADQLRQVPANTVRAASRERLPVEVGGAGDGRGGGTEDEASPPGGGDDEQRRRPDERLGAVRYRRRRRCRRRESAPVLPSCAGRTRCGDRRETKPAPSPRSLST